MDPSTPQSSRSSHTGRRTCAASGSEKKEATVERDIARDSRKRDPNLVVTDPEVGCQLRTGPCAATEAAAACAMQPRARLSWRARVA